ncbi:MAG: hypothetical protein JNL39_05470 [Opitutaceae bacterium]|nr:hypothetical protein [Opitutaceae bacterium]
MQTLPPAHLSTATFFSRERRRQRMLKFLETFELRSWPVVGDHGFLVPMSRADLREPAAGRASARR